jgi:dTDP-6-deoxy-L-talose 4-dehydrogenase (NAD+)
LDSPLNTHGLQGSLSLGEGAVRAGVRRFVGVGTCFEYDLSTGLLDVDTPLRPATPYAAAKAATSLGLSRWLPAAGVGFAWCRLFHLYGEHEDARRLAAYVRSRLAAGLRAELSSGQVVRDFLDVAEAGRRIAAVACGTHAGALNVCSGEPVTVRQLAERIADEYGRRDLLAFGARPDNPLEPPRIVGVPTEVA